MMSPDNLAAKSASVVAKEDNQSSGNKKTSATTRPQDQALKCPRCDSPNTKFCYYNNYSLIQPRHFCKTCRRYWTKGGSLRNVPIGGGCRKNKKMKPSSSRLSCDSKDSSDYSSSEIGGLKFFHGLSPAMDFQLGGLSFPRPNNPSPATGIYNQFSSWFGDATSPSCFTLDPSGNSLVGFNYPVHSSVTNTHGFNGAIQEMAAGSMNVNSSLASSIESLSSLNQDLHWKLQQQRLGMLFGPTGDHNNNQKESSPSAVSTFPLEISKPQPILFQNLEISKPEINSGAVAGNSRREGETATEWFFGNCYAPAVTPTPNNSSGNNANDNANNWNNGVQVWGDLNQYSALP